MLLRLLAEENLSYRKKEIISARAILKEELKCFSPNVDPICDGI